MRPRPILKALAVAIFTLAITVGAIALFESDAEETLTAADGSVRPTEVSTSTTTLKNISTTTAVTAPAISSATPTTTSRSLPAPAPPASTEPATPPPTTVAGNSPSRSPSVSIISPASGSRFVATYDPVRENFGAVVGLSAAVSDPEDDAYAVEWNSSIDGFLGVGQSITARLRPAGDASQPVITAVATDVTGARGEASVQIVVWIPSDQ